MVKAAREAKMHTSWLNPDEDYESALTGFVDQVLIGPAAALFLRDVQSLVRRLEGPGMCNALAQTVLRLTVPGVPDTYQGTELWDDSLVDPDNRRPVDFKARQGSLRQFRTGRAGRNGGAVPRNLWAERRDGRIKQYLLWRLLHLRRERPDVFLRGCYVPLAIAGERAAHVLAFARVLEGQMLLVAVPRLTSLLEQIRGGPPLAEVWENTRVDLAGVVPDGGGALNWRNVLSGERLRQKGRTLDCTDLFADLPVAVLSYRSRSIIFR